MSPTAPGHVPVAGRDRSSETKFGGIYNQCSGIILSSINQRSETACLKLFSPVAG